MSVRIWLDVGYFVPASIVDLSCARYTTGLAGSPVHLRQHNRTHHEKGSETMYADPQTVTIDSVPYTCNRIAIGDMNATYRTADETVQLRVSHRSAKNRVRRMARIDQTIISTDPLTTDQDYETAGVYVVVDEPKVGFSDEQLQNIVSALVAWLTASSNANTTKLLGSET